MKRQSSFERLLPLVTSLICIYILLIKLVKLK